MAINVQHNPQDLTGRKKAELAEKYAEEQRAAARRMATISAAEAEVNNEPVDLSGPDEVLDVATEVAVKVEKKKMRVNTQLHAVTIGHGNTYDFEVGQVYKVTRDVYDYLDELGYVWH